MRTLSKDEVKKRIEFSIKESKARIAAWENVKRVYKKDGKSFKVLSKNFTNCFIGDNKWRDGKVIEVTYYEGYHRTDSINITKVDEMYWDGTPPNDDNLYSIYGGEPQFFDMNVEQVSEAIEMRIEKEKRYLENDELELQIIDDVLDCYISSLKTAYRTAVSKIRESGVNMHCSTIECSLVELANDIKWLEEV